MTLTNKITAKWGKDLFIHKEIYVCARNLTHAKMNSHARVCVRAFVHVELKAL